MLAGGARADARTTGFDPPLAVDLNPDPHILEVNLTAAPVVWEFKPGVQTNALAYNGTIPGPTLMAEAGDLLIVHFTNNLGEPTTIHWHGIETPAAMDGSHISQLTIPDGGSFDYQFTLNRVGTFWYHPHVRTPVMVEHGLYGAVVVKDSALDQQIGLPTADEHLVLFDDVLFDENGQFATFTPSDPLEWTEYQLNGREGNVLVINGREGPTRPPLEAANGEPTRWRVINVANTTFCRLDLNESWGGKVWQIGGDQGLNPHPRWRFKVIPVPPPGGPEHISDWNRYEGIFLMPGERMEVVFSPSGQPDEVIAVNQWDFHRGRHHAEYDTDGVTILLDHDHMDGYRATVNCFSLKVVGYDTTGPGYYEPPYDLAPFTPIDPNASTGNLTVTFGHGPPEPGTGNVTMFAQMVNGNPMPMGKMTSLQAYDVLIGDVMLWEVINLSHGEHPFHSHGFSFQPIEFEFVDLDEEHHNFKAPLAYQENKDTFQVPGRPGHEAGRSWTIFRALVHFTDAGREGLARAAGLRASPDTSGGWLFHCHVIEHAAAGMMSFIETRYPDDAWWNLGGASSGAGGFPYLEGSGDLMPGGTVTLALEQAKANAPVFVLAGSSAANTYLKGGILIPAPSSIVAGFATDASGTRALPVTWPTLPPGFQAFIQILVQDNAGGYSHVLSNGIRVTQP